MCDRKFDQRIQVIVGMEKRFEIAQQIANEGFAFRWGVHDTPSGARDLDPRCLANTGVGAPDDADNVDQQVRANRALLDRLPGASWPYWFW